MLGAGVGHDAATRTGVLQRAVERFLPVLRLRFRRRQRTRQPPPHAVEILARQEILRLRDQKRRILQRRRRRRSVLAFVCITVQPPPCDRSPLSSKRPASTYLRFHRKTFVKGT